MRVLMGQKGNCTITALDARGKIAWQKKYNCADPMEYASGLLHALSVGSKGAKKDDTCVQLVVDINLEEETP